MIKGIAELKARGTKVHLSYGKTGLGPKTGGGESWESIDATQAEFLAQRIVKNVLDWDLDGVDIFAYLSINNYMNPSLNVAFHYSVIKNFESTFLLMLELSSASASTGGSLTRRSLYLASDGRSYFGFP